MSWFSRAPHLTSRRIATVYLRTRRHPLFRACRGAFAVYGRVQAMVRRRRRRRSLCRRNHGTGPRAWRGCPLLAGTPLFDRGLLVASAPCDALAATVRGMASEHRVVRIVRVVRVVRIVRVVRNVLGTRVSLLLPRCAGGIFDRLSERLDR